MRADELHHRYAPNLISDRDRGFSFEAFIPPKFKSHSFAHRGARVIDTDTLLRISLVLRVSSDGQEHEQIARTIQMLMRIKALLWS
jgi:hypothetical protein